MAPPLKLTPEVQDTIARMIKVGVPIEMAAEAAGIARSTFFDWLKRGEAKGTKNKRFRDFRAAIEQARAEAEATLVTRIAKAAQNGSWSAAAWLLERRAPERWAKPSERTRGDQSTDEAEKPKPSTLDALDELAERRRRATAVR